MNRSTLQDKPKSTTGFSSSLPFPLSQFDTTSDSRPLPNLNLSVPPLPCISAFVTPSRSSFIRPCYALIALLVSLTLLSPHLRPSVAPEQIRDVAVDIFRHQPGALRSYAIATGEPALVCMDSCVRVHVHVRNLNLLARGPVNLTCHALCFLTGDRDLQNRVRSGKLPKAPGRSPERSPKKSDF